MNGNGSDAEPRPRANVPTALALVVAAVAVLGGAAWAYDRAAPNVDVVRLELAGTLAEAQRVAGANAAAFADAVRADFVLIAGYVVALLLLGVLGQRVFWTPGARKMVSRMMVVAVAAAALDAAENALLLDFLHRPTVLDGELTMRLAQAAAFTKFTLLAAAGIVAVVAVGVTLSRLLLLLWSHLWGSTREPLRRGVDVFAPVQPSPSSNGGATTHWDSARNVPPRRDVADVGIAVSGGGIRSACVTLGALQSLRQRGELQRASYLVSVSGGGYMAGAFRLALQQVPDRPPPTGTNDASPRDVFAPGSAEEDHLRRHSNYVADGAREWIIALWTVLRGVVVSLALITLTVAVAGLLLSRFYELVRVVHLDQLRPRFVADPAQKAPAFPSPPAGVLLAIGATAVAAFASFGFGILVLSVFAKPFRRRGRITRDLAALAALLAVIGVALPALVWASARLTWGLGVKGAVSTATGSAVGAVLLAYLGTLVGVLWRKRQTIGKQVGTVRGWITGAGGKSGTQQAVPTSLLQRLIVLAALLILSLGFLLVLGWVVATAPLWPTPWRFGLPAVLAFCAIFLDQTWLGLHPFYRRRLASAFAVRRLKSPKGKVFAAAYPFDAESTPLSDYAARPAGTFRRSSSPLRPTCQGRTGPRPAATRSPTPSPATSSAARTSAGSRPRSSSGTSAGTWPVTSPCRRPWPSPARRSRPPWGGRPRRSRRSSRCPMPGWGHGSRIRRSCTAKPSTPARTHVRPASSGRGHGCPGFAACRTCYARSLGATPAKTGCCSAPMAATTRTSAWSSCYAAGASWRTASTPAATPHHWPPPWPKRSPWPPKSSASRSTSTSHTTSCPARPTPWSPRTPSPGSTAACRRRRSAPGPSTTHPSPASPTAAPAVWWWPRPP